MGKPLQIMFLGTNSDAGKSIITTGFCRILKNLGYRVCPFKAQNMALNSYVTMNGEEIGRSQALQALASGIPPHSDMNPVLIKPSSEYKSQIILQGKVLDNFSAEKYYKNISNLLPKVKESYTRLKKHYNAIVLEGAGSTAELNLKDRDIVNIKMARIAGAPAILIADIDRGGVFASLYGTIKLLNKKERRQIIGIIINKFRGEKSLFQEGIKIIEKITGKKVFGILPFLDDLYLPEEDSVALHKKRRGLPKPDASLEIGVIKLPYISNYTDFDPLELEEDVSLTYIDSPVDIKGKNAIIIPGTKSTLMDLKWLHEKSFTRALRKYVETGGLLMGICGGYQILGRTVMDPFHTESSREKEDGLGLLPITTTLEKNKKLENVKAKLNLEILDDIGLAYINDYDKNTIYDNEQLSLDLLKYDIKREREFGQKILRTQKEYYIKNNDTVNEKTTHSNYEITGYEIHMGETEFQKKLPHLFLVFESNGTYRQREDGCILNYGRGKVIGTYIHGVFENDNFREIFFRLLGYKKPISLRYRETLNKKLDELASFISSHIDVKEIIRRAERFR